MKRLSVCIVLCLVMCLTMSFPASAVTYLSDYEKVTNAFLNDYDYYCKPLLPSGYNYKFVLASTLGAGGALQVYYSDTPVITSTTKLYIPGNVTYPEQGLSSLTVNITSMSYSSYGKEIKLEYKYSSGSTGTRFFKGYLVNHSTAVYTGLGNIVSTASSDGADFELYLLENVDTTELRTLLNIADGVEDIGYTPVTWTRFSTARTNGHALLAQSSYTQSDVSYATTELSVSMSSLALQAVNPPPTSSSTPDYPATHYGNIGTGDVSAFLVPFEGKFLDNALVVLPIVIGIFAIILGIKLIPKIFYRIMR